MKLKHGVIHNPSTYYKPRRKRNTFTVDFVKRITMDIMKSEPDCSWVIYKKGMIYSVTQ